MKIRRKIAGKIRKVLSLVTERQALQAEIKKLRRDAAYYRESRPANWCLRFARRAFDAAEALRADVHVAHGVQALPAADMVARATGGRLICDAIEIPAFASRTTPTEIWDPTNLAFMDLALESYLRRCDAILTIGWALKNEITHFGPPVHVIPNYRRAESLSPSTRLRDWCGLAGSDELVLAISLIYNGLEEVIRSLQLLPEHVHLALVGRLHPPSYGAKIEALLEELGLGRRVHLFDFVPYPELTATAAGADVGLIVRDTGILNNRISLPNRVFDYMASGLPVCSPDIPDITRILREHDMGVVVETLDPPGWAQAIMSALVQKNRMRANALAAARALSWENLEDELFETLGRPASVTFFGLSDLGKNNRTLRMAGSLAQRGVRVTICTHSKDAPPPIADLVRFHLLQRH